MANAPSLEEMRRLLAELPGPDLEAERATAQRVAGLGRLAELAAWVAAWQGRHPPRIARPRAAIFAASHGVAARAGVPADAAAAAVRLFVEGGAAVNRLCRSLDADLRVYEMALEQPTADLAEAPAMSEEECARAMAYGMMAVEPGIDLLALGEAGGGSELAAAALAALLFGGAGADWVEAGARRAAELVDAAIDRHRSAAGDPFEARRRAGGPDLAAIAGAVRAARMARVPVVLDGFASTAAAAVIFAARPGALDHCRVGPAAAGAGEARLLERLGQAPLLELGAVAGGGIGSTAAVALLRAAVACAEEDEGGRA
jgi:nicotinate-nucleotide--dimethylbenzimidazole phosphoribosyltransferase